MTQHSHMTYVTVLNLLLIAQDHFRKDNLADAVSSLVAAEQRIPAIDDALQFLAAQNAADKVWRDYMIAGGLEKSGEFKLGNAWQVA